MTPSVRVSSSVPAGVEVVLTGWHPDSDGPVASDLLATTGVDLTRAVRSTPTFTGGLSDDPVVIPSMTEGTPVVVIAGLGPRATCGPDEVRRAVHCAAPASRGHGTAALAFAPQTIEAALEGYLLGCYSSPASTTVAQLPWPASVHVVVTDAVAMDDRWLEHARVAAEQTNWARRLVETPAADLGPAELAEEIVSGALAHGVAASIWSTDLMRERGFGAVLAVGQGSHRPPCVVELQLGPATAASLGLVGKGVVFDSGGINLKRNASEVAWMKSDMAGAVACAGALIGAARLGVTAPARAVLPLVENMPGGGAVRPGDVVHHPNGRSTEVTDTDCEGRLILADALAYLAASGVTGLIDVATLTDAAGFGPALWAAASNDAALCAEVLAAGSAAGDPGWQIPIPADYVRLLESPVADVANAAGGVPDSTVIAATYLRQFVGDVAWVHIDNGSTAYLERPWQGWAAGATGSPLRTLLRLLSERLS